MFDYMNPNIRFFTWKQDWKQVSGHNHELIYNFQVKKKNQIWLKFNYKLLTSHFQTSLNLFKRVHKWAKLLHHIASWKCFLCKIIASLFSKKVWTCSRDNTTKPSYCIIFSTQSDEWHLRRLPCSGSTTVAALWRAALRW